MTEIVPGIHQLKVPIPNNPLENTNVYLIQSDDGYVLIDAGWNDNTALQVLHDQLSDIGVEFHDISRILITHAHHDHYGLAGRLRELSGATIALSRIDRDFLSPQYSSFDEYLDRIEHWFRGNGVPEKELPASRMFATMRRTAASVLPDVILDEGDIISIGDLKIRVVWTPGHTPGHVCFYEPERKLLFAGDHVLSVITPNISMLPLSRNNPLADFIGALNKVKLLDISLTLPAHEQLIEDLHGRIDEIIQHHEIRSQEILDALKGEPMTAFSISGHITWMPEFGGVHFDNLEVNDRRMAIMETLAHLEAMRVDSRVIRADSNEMVLFQRG